KATLTYPDNSTNSLDKDQLFEQVPDNIKYEVVAPEKTPVKDIDNLTDEDKNKAIDEIKKANHNAKDVSIDENGKATLTYPDNSTNSLDKDQLFEQVPDNIKYEVVAPEKTPVKDIDNLTDEDKNKAIDEIKKANPNAKDVSIDENGKATLTYPDNSTNSLDKDQLFEQVPDNIKYEVVAPEKTPVKDIDNLTDEDKNKAIDEIKKANPNAKDVSIDENGKATLTYPDNSTNSLDKDQLFEQVPDNIKYEVVAPEKTPVKD